ncbi:MAG: NADH:ubiquinone reductase (Na(+)-transporting) subunit D [Deltaproteobacteria bacterium]|nr:NADH:ubiquinone reductase (Na(+)-transporting) subunit D [Deltaproteobacteria bacterium]MBW2696849.1 NADH:ubiquinone reductase (Na(+)-transporting) subunit D [Deltaproteobacteria bacterium]
MNEPRLRDVMWEPIFDRNPITLLMLGICSALAVTTKLETAVAMSLAVLGVLVGSSLILSAVRRHVPDTIRIFAQISIIATLVIVVDQLLQAFFWDLSKQLSIFVGLIVTNCIVMGRTEGFALKHGPLLSIGDAIGHALGYGAVLLALGFVRELLGAGRVFGHVVLRLQSDGGWYVPMGLMGRAPVAFILIAMLIWALKTWKSEPAEA